MKNTVMGRTRIRHLLRLPHRALKTYLTKSAERKFKAGKTAAGYSRLLRSARYPDEAVFYRLGNCCERGEGTVQNFTQAANWYEAAAALGSVPAMVRLGKIFSAGPKIGGGPEAGRNISGSQQETRPWTALRSLGSVSPNPQKAAYWNRLAAQAGSPDAQASLASQYLNGRGVEPDAKEALRWFGEAARQGSASGQLGLGLLLASGASGKADYLEAAIWLERAAAQGKVKAAVVLAQMIIDDALPDSRAPHIARMLISAATDDTRAMFQLGTFYMTGRGVKQDPVAAATWLQRACSRGHLPAFPAIADLLLAAGAQPDRDQAIRILRQGAEFGDIRCQLRLAELHASELPADIGWSEAMSWRDRAGRHGFISARAFENRASYGYGPGSRWLEKDDALALP